jgi:hypothetical protein
MLQVPLTPETEATLRQRASEHGEDVAAYAARLLRDAVTAPSVNELLAPFRRQVEQSGVTDEELDGLCEELRQDVWQEQQTKKA